LDRGRIPIVSRLNNSPDRPILCYVTDRQDLRKADPEDACEGLLHKVDVAAAAGVNWIQIREKDLSGKVCASLTREVLRRAAKPSAAKAAATRILVNDRLDVALAERAGGVHLGENSLPIAEVRQFVDSLGPDKDFLIGASRHSLEAARSAAKDGVDYLFFGPVFATPSKAAYGAPQGLERLAEVCRAVSIPVLAIGGITLESAASCLAAGASGIAAIRLFQDAPSVVGALRSL
jgi:thiamine-phosphate pyrophosphorylase